MPLLTLWFCLFLFLFTYKVSGFTFCSHRDFSEWLMGSALHHLESETHMKQLIVGLLQKQKRWIWDCTMTPTISTGLRYGLLPSNYWFVCCPDTFPSYPMIFMWALMVLCIIDVIQLSLHCPHLWSFEERTHSFCILITWLVPTVTPSYHSSLLLAGVCKLRR